jgi:hypothetical protein
MSPHEIWVRIGRVIRPHRVRWRTTGVRLIRVEHDQVARADHVAVPPVRRRRHTVLGKGDEELLVRVRVEANWRTVARNSSKPSRSVARHIRSRY